MSEELKPDTVVAGTFDFQANMGDGKALVLRGYVFNGEDASKQLDHFHDLIDRQRARAEIPKLEIEVDVLFMKLRQHKEHLEGLVKAQDAMKSKDKLSSTERKQMEPGSTSNQQIDNIRITIGHIQEEIDKGMAAVAKAKEKAK